MSERYTVLFVNTDTVDGRRIEGLTLHGEELPVAIKRDRADDGTPWEGSETFGIMSDFEWEGNRLTAAIEPEVPEGFVVGADVTGGTHEEQKDAEKTVLHNGVLRGATLIEDENWVWPER